MEISIDGMPKLCWDDRGYSVQRFQMVKQLLLNWKFEGSWPLIVIVNPGRLGIVVIHSNVLGPSGLWQINKMKRYSIKVDILLENLSMSFLGRSICFTRTASNGKRTGAPNSVSLTCQLGHLCGRLPILI